VETALQQVNGKSLRRGSEEEDRIHLQKYWIATADNIIKFYDKGFVILLLTLIDASQQHSA